MLKIISVLRQQSREDDESRIIQQEYKEYNYRYVISLLYYLSTIGTSITQITCSPISNTLQNVYKLDAHQIDITSLLFTILYIPANIPATYIIDKYGLRSSISCGVILCSIGAWIRTGINMSFKFVFIGQVIAGCGNAFVMNSLTKLSGNWFKTESRFKATTFNMLASSLGMAIGFIIPPYFIQEADKYQTLQRAQTDIKNLFTLEATLVTLFAIPCVLLFKSKPPTPPSVAATLQQEDDIKSILSAIRDKNFFFLVLQFSLGYALYIGLQVVITSIVIPYGFSEQEAAFFGLLFNFGSMIGLLLSLFLLKLLKSYKLIIVTSYILSISSLICFTGALVWEMDAYINITAVALGVGLQLFWNVSLELGCELTFPLGEASSTSWLQTLGCLMSIFHLYIMEFCMRHKNQKGSLAATLVNLSFMLSALLCTSAIQEILKRFEFEKNLKQKKPSPRQSLNDLEESKILQKSTKEE